MTNKVKQFLNEEQFGWVIIDSISHPKLVALMSRLGISYPGVRTSSLPIQELAYDLSNDAFGNTEIMGALIKTLNELNYEVIKKIEQMCVEEVKDIIVSGEKVFPLSRETGKLIWALIADPRPVINELVRELLKNIKEDMEDGARIAQEMEKRLKKMSDKLSLKGYKKLLDSISTLKNELARQEKFSAELLSENQRLRIKGHEQQELIHQLRRAEGGFIQEKSRWLKEIEKKEREIEKLNFDIAELKNKLAVGPKSRLKSEIHHLEKEVNKFNHLLAQQSRESSEKISTLEKESLELKQAIKDMHQINLKLKEQLEAQTHLYEGLKKEYEVALVKKEQLLPPQEKGRRLGVFIDNQNVYYSSKRYFGKKLDYTKLLSVLVRDRHLVKAICYVVQQPDTSQDGFINMLKNNGYTVRTRDLILRGDGSAKGNWDIGIAVDVITMVEKNSLDSVVLVTCDGDFVDLVKLLSAKGIEVEVVGFSQNMAMDLRKEADDYYFITKDLMIES